VTWVVESKDRENDPILYRFFVNGKPVTNWSVNNKWSWQTNETCIGENQIETQVRQRNHLSEDRFDHSKSASFTIVESRPLSGSLDITISDRIFQSIIILGGLFYLLIRRL
jgi:hypothetical protein